MILIWLFALISVLLCAVVNQEGMCLRLIATGEDEDMKIATPGSFPKSKAAEDAGSIEAKQYLKLKEDGSIDRARVLGSRYAAMLLNAKEALCGCEDMDDPLCEHQRLVLYSYIINRAISDLSSNSMLAQTSLKVFYDEIEEVSPDLHRHISDMAAFSLYILCERGSRNPEEEIGKVYAKLCDNEGNQAAIGEGRELYTSFYALCVEAFNHVGHSEL